MPELPEVETVKNGLAPFLEGRRVEEIILRRSGLRIPFPADLTKVFAGALITRLSRRAKYLLIHTAQGRVMIVHLGMSGQMTVVPRLDGYEPAKHDHMIIRMEGGGGVAFNDARRFGMVMTAGEEDWGALPAFVGLGPEPLSNEFSGPVLLERLRGRQTPIKQALLDQHVVAGGGNIYASEALHRAQIHPALPAGALTPAQADTLALCVREVLNKAIMAGGSTLKDFRQSDGSLGYFQHDFTVYGRGGEPCRRCVGGDKLKESGPQIMKIVQGGRATYFCPQCQSLPAAPRKRRPTKA